MMKTGFLSLSLCVTVSLLLLATPSAQSASLVFTANLSGAAENPPVASPGTGFATVTHNSLLHTLRVQATFSDLIGPTTVAHIHAPVEAPGNVGVATQVPTFPGFPAGVTAGTYDMTFDMTLASSFNPAFLTNFGGGDPAGAEAALVAALLEGRAYLNIHTTLHPGGEIRGFLVRSVPEPGTGLASALVLLGLAGLTRLRRRTEE
jgi:MYXO-CTERM domain-containing protein